MRSSALLLLFLSLSPFVLAASSATPAKSTPPRTARQKFVLEVVGSAVALPEPDPQDHLRVLQSAATVLAPIDSVAARRLAREGARLEAELISSGITPAVSMLAGGQVDCAVAKEFVEAIPASAVQLAENSLVSAMTLCKQAQDPARAKVESALDSGIVASRALLALMESAGPRSAWSQAQFSKMFASLPADAVNQAPDLAAMFAQEASAVEKDVARDAGLKFLNWLGKLRDSGERNLAIHIATDALRKALGEGYEEALRSDPVASSVASSAGQPGEIQHPVEESVSVLKAMGARGEDYTESLQAMPATRKAREAAAHGFAAGTAGDRENAQHYFDIAFSAVDEVWSARNYTGDAPAVVEEVSEAAAQVDPVAALRRSQRLGDPTAQAISMIAVARVVVGHQ